MQDLIKQEQFELEVLDKLNSHKILSRLVFAGGTMLRLCFGLNRFSVDLDFWIMKGATPSPLNELFRDVKECFSHSYFLKDATNKFHTLLFEVKSPQYPRGLKIEIRKDTKKVKTQQAIAYSPHSHQQVLLNVVSLPDMMKAKIEAFLERREIRDVFDIEFLIKKGVGIEAPVASLQKLVQGIDAFNKKDYTVKLGSHLEEEYRKYYAQENFKILKSALRERLQWLKNST